jgi:hypothetical protein
MEPIINGTVPKSRSDLRLGIYGCLITLQSKYKIYYEKVAEKRKMRVS